MSAVFRARSRLALLAAPLLLAAAPARGHRFEDQLAAFAREDRGTSSPAGALLFVGSSTIRLWPALARSFAPQPVVRRGFGGATLAEVVAHRDLLFAPHRPAAIVLYAGENDVAEGAAPERVVARWCELRRHLRTSPAGAAPVIFIGLKPSPRRFTRWPDMRRVNAAIRRLDGDLAPAAYVDTAAFVLADGRPNPALFRDDGLHFNAAGYACLTARVVGAVGELSAVE